MDRNNTRSILAEGCLRYGSATQVSWGTHLVTGTTCAVVVATSKDTRCGNIAQVLAGGRAAGAALSVRGVAEFQCCSGREGEEGEQGNSIGELHG